MIVERASQDKLSNVDAVLTTRAGIGLAVRTADCLPVLIHHPSGLIGAVHAGRKGTEAGILSKVGKIIKTDFNLEEGLHFWFGPAICNQCYQIDEQKDLHYNLLRNNTDQLYKIFKPEKINIHFANICTLEHPEYHSYRETGQGVEMNYSAIVLPKS